MARPTMLDFKNTFDPCQLAREEVERRYQAVMANSGQLTLLGTTYTVHKSEMKEENHIGHGNYGEVTRYDFRGHPMAVKKMPRTNDPVEGKRVIMDLATVSKTGDCPNIVECYGYFVYETEVLVCMELMATCLAGILKATQQPFPEPIIGKMAVSIVNALHYLKAEHNVIHRDVKPSNILIDNHGTIKLCDFGISGILENSRAHTVQAGCPPYMAPERCDPQSSSNYDIRSDIWSLGITLYELAVGNNPYYDQDSEFEMLASILDKPSPKLPAEGNFSPEFRNFVECCLQKDPKLRPKYDVLMQHPFLQRSVHDTETSVEDWFSDIWTVDDM